MTNKDSKANSRTKDSGNGSVETESGEVRYLLGQILVDLGYITVYQLDEALIHPHHRLLCYQPV